MPCVALAAPPANQTERDVDELVERYLSRIIHYPDVSRVNDPRYKLGQEATRTLGAAAVPRLAYWAKTGSPDKRLGAVAMLGELADEKTRSELSSPHLDLLIKAKPGFVGVPARLLGHLRSKKAVEILATRMVQGLSHKMAPSDSVLVRVGNPPRLQWVKLKDPRARWTAKDVRNDFMRQMGYAAKVALRRIGGDEVHKHMLRVLPKANDESRGHVAELLGFAGRPEATAALVPLTRNKAARLDAMIALGRIGTDQAVEHLLSLLKSSKDDVRGNAALALGLAKSPKAVDPLIAALKDEEENVRMWAALSLGKIGEPRAGTALLAATGNTPEAFRALADLKDRRAVPLLMARLRKQVKETSNMFGDQTDPVRTIECLGKIGDRSCVPALCRILSELSTLTEQARDIARALGEIGDPRAFDALGAYIVICRKEDFRAVGCEAIGKLGGKKTRVYLSALVAARPEDVRQLDRIIRTFKTSPMLRFNLTIKSFMQNKSYHARTPMARALGAIGDPAAVPVLLDVLKEPDQIPRRGKSPRPDIGQFGQRHLQLQVVRALGRIADARAKDALKKVTKNPEVLLRCFAADALKRIAAGPKKPPAVARPTPRTRPATTKDPEALAAKALKLAKLYIASERLKSAARTLREIIKKWPKTDAAQKARTLLKSIE